MEDIRLQKKELRRAYKTLGAKLTEEYRRESDAAIREAVLASTLWKNAESLFIYVSMWAEPDTRALIAAALEAGKRVYVPLCFPDGVMKAVRIQSPDELSPGTLGIPEPPAENEAAGPGDLDLTVVPCVTVTKSGERLGHGAGYYDRFLHLYRCPALCLCYGRMLADAVPTDENDVRMDFVVTESGAVSCVGR